MSRDLQRWGADARFSDGGIVGTGTTYRTANSMGNCDGIATLIDAGR